MSLADRLIAGVKAAVGGGTYLAPPDRVPVFSDPGAGIIGEFVSLRDIVGQSPAALYRSQPHLRTVVDFVARNIAQLGVHAYTYAADGGRERDRTSPLARAFVRANSDGRGGGTTGYELIRDTVSDLMLEDQALWFVNATRDALELQVIRAAWVGGRRLRVNADDSETLVWVINRPGSAAVEIPVDRTIHFHGWSPDSVASGVSPVETLKAILAEQVSAQTFRDQLWRNGGRVGTYLSRPATTTAWSDKDRRRFAEVWRSRYAGNNASAAGSTPVLEDGMTMGRVGFSSGDEQYVEGAKLALATVAAVYHVNPTMVGQLDNANYSNVREFRRMLYGDTLGPTLAMIEARLNAFLLPMAGVDDAVTYLEFNIAEKLQGSFEEQAAVLTSATGGPWSTVNEARRMMNRPAVEGGDRLLTPLNMGTLDAEPPAADEVPAEPKARPAELTPRQPLELKARGKVRPSTVAEAHVKAVQQVLAGYFARQRVAVLRAIAAGSKGGGPDVKAPGWWDGKRWDRELADDLYGVAINVATEVGQDTAKALGYDAADYDEPRTANFLKAVAATRAGYINAATVGKLEQAVASAEDDDDDSEMTPESVFDDAETGGRGAATALTLVTTLTGFATVEAGRQLAPDAATKTWRTTSGNPRADHAAMDGETVGIDDTFSNGAAWAGDPSLGADGVAGCQCIIDVNIP